MADTVADGIAAVQIGSPAPAKPAPPPPPQLLYYDGFAAGCPRPPCDEERTATAQGIHKAMELKDGELGASRTRRRVIVRACCALLTPCMRAAATHCREHAAAAVQGV